MEKDIGKIKKNDTADIVVRIDDFGGRKGLTIREFVSSEKYTGFTKAGVRIPAAEFVGFREMINSIVLSDMKEEAQTEASKSSAHEKVSANVKSASREELPDY
jgi:hypothetical protein